MIKLEEDSYGPLKIWEYPIEEAQYVVGTDVMEGEPRATDFSCHSIWKVMVKTGTIGEQVAEWRSRIEPEILGRIGVQLGTYYNNALWAIEVQGGGRATLAEARRLDYWNLFMRPYFDQVTKQSERLFGWKTDVTSKLPMVTFGRYCINHDKVGIRSRGLLEELETFSTENVRGTMGAAKSTQNDDRVIAALIAWKVIEFEFIGAEGDIGVKQPPSEDVRKKQRIDRDVDPFFVPKKHPHWLDF